MDGGPPSAPEGVSQGQTDLRTLAPHLPPLREQLRPGSAMPGPSSFGASKTPVLAAPCPRDVRLCGAAPREVPTWRIPASEGLSPEAGP